MAGETFTEELRRNSVTDAFYDLEAFPDPENITLAQLNTANERLRQDVTCAEDESNTSFNKSSSDTNDNQTYCDQAGASRPTNINPEISIGIRRDKDRNAQGVFNKALNWLKHTDAEFYYVRRVGDQDSGPLNGQPAKPYEITDDIRILHCKVDHGSDILADATDAIFNPNVTPAGFFAWNIHPKP